MEEKPRDGLPERISPSLPEGKAKKYKPVGKGTPRALGASGSRRSHDQRSRTHNKNRRHYVSFTPHTRNTTCLLSSDAARISASIPRAARLGGGDFATRARA